VKVKRMQNVAIIGKGHVGSSLGIRLTKAGYHIKFGVREGSSAEEVLAKCNGKAEAVSVKDAAQWADLVILAVPASAAVDVVKSFGDVKGKILVDCTNPIQWGKDLAWAQTPEGSMAASIAKVAPTAKVVKGFNTLGSGLMIDPTVGDLPADVFFAGDNDSKKAVSKIAEDIGFRVFDAGPLQNAGALENLALLWIYFASSGGLEKPHTFKLIGRP
jgi:NADPH-dependent F420 reductase